MGKLGDQQVTDDDVREANRANWDERATLHEAGSYEVSRYAEDPEQISSVVTDDRAPLARALGRDPLAARPLEGLDLLHLQCHIGTDTLSLARLGARVTGADFSPASLEAARRLFAASGAPGTFIETDVQHAGDNVPGSFDVIYTSIGTVTWFRDLDAWAAGIAKLLRPGGTFYIRDGHPVMFSLDDERTDGELVVRYRGMADGTSEVWDDEDTYGSDDKLTNVRTYDWPHSLSEIVSALIGAGLTITGMDEGRTLPWDALPQMTLTADGGSYELPEHQRFLVPLTYTITARR
ncbi:class I SAM-dependent methyltransferase [Tessaracoccus sp. MC1865]|uniref:class I SAM-dependent methyltransferase n=1 Tax=unclassified Tessaracoccus TaxID=2635419 RepID=UPI0015FF00D7|nr:MULTISPECIES: class I SAM-dependent methyltransferase [unclassified Tessaracoccus]MBB1482256.1 class I SAM-dependent methyltransferase [Tessaracoccus sp. MC1865]MBB1509501.1 class I SAM-dependent methyltransferase [Tessaracoccus sp. MC1756]QTO38271.1 class I SAM-dependent methyltransferase [Tessaracoccus sp. MC1865]